MLPKKLPKKMRKYARKSSENDVIPIILPTFVSENHA